jgi:hypothetical protein
MIATLTPLSLPWCSLCPPVPRCSSAGSCLMLFLLLPSLLLLSNHYSLFSAHSFEKREEGYNQPTFIGIREETWHWTALDEKSTTYVSV